MLLETISVAIALLVEDLQKKCLWIVMVTAVFEILLYRSFIL